MADTALPALDISIVLPAYEEAANLDRLLPLLSQTLTSMSLQYEILVVDTPTERDDTRAVSIKHGATYIPRRGGSLYGHAVRTGIAEAKGQRVIFMDADGSHNPSFMPQLWAPRNEADLVIASRYVKGGKTENPFVLILMSLAVNLLFRIVLGLKCADVSNSFRLYKAEQIKRLTLECDNFDIVEEILVKLAHQNKNFRIREVPFTFEKRQAGKTKRKLVAFALGYVGTLNRLYKMKNTLPKNIEATL